MANKKKNPKGLRDLGLDNAFRDDESEDDYENPFISKITAGDEPSRPIVNQLDYQTALPETVKAFESEGFSLGAINAERAISAEPPIADFKPIRRFFSRLDISKQDLETFIPVMKRLKGFQYKKDSKGKIIKTVKEFLVWHLQLRGVDFLGAGLYTCIENEGQALSPRVHTDITYDPQTGRQTAVRRFTGITEKRYYVPFSKNKVDELIKRFNDGDKENIKYYGFVPANNTTLTEDYHTDIYTYDQFVNTDWEQFVDISRRWHDKTEKDMKNNPPSLQSKGIA